MKFIIHTSDQNKAEEVLKELITVYDKEYGGIAKEAKGKIDGKFPMVNTDFIPEESFAHMERNGDTIIFRTSLYVPKVMYMMKLPLKKAEKTLINLLKNNGIKKVKVKCVKDD